MPLDYNLLKLTPPEPTIKYQSAQDFLKGAQETRDARRKRAIEEAMRQGVDSTGELNELALRKSLADAGFGEDAESVVRSITSPRADDVSKIATLGMQLKELVDAGIVSREKAEELMGNTAQISRTPVSPSSDTTWMAGVPQTQGIADSQAGISEDGSIRITAQQDEMQPLYDYERKESKAQAVPQFAANLIDFAKKENELSLGDISTTGSALKYTLPTGADKDYILAAAKTLGFTGNTSEAIDSELTQRAMAQVPKPVLTPKGYDVKSRMEARAEYTQKMAEYPALVAQKKADLIKQLEAGQAARFGQGVTREQESRAKETQDYGLAGQKDVEIFARPVSPAEAVVVKLQRATISDIVAATPDFAGAYQAAVAKAKSDGSVNQDAIISNLVAMGALPSGEAVYLKTMMSPDGAILPSGFKWVANKGFGERGPSKAWKTQAIDNINGFIVDNGGKPVPVVGSPRTAKEALEQKGVGQTKPKQPKPSAPQKPRRKATKDDF